VARHPAQARLAPCSGKIFAADPAAISDPIDQAEKLLILDLASDRLGAVGPAGYLDVADTGEMARDCRPPL
jgi:hypothetical protein